MDSLNIDNITKPLECRGVLARLSISQWTARKTDKKIAKEDAKRTGSDESMHSHSRRILAKSALEKIDKVVSQARKFHEDNTLPWHYDGVGVLHTANFLNYMKEMRDYERQFQAAVAEFLPKYQDAIKEAAGLLGDTFNEKDYPHPIEVARKFSFVFEISKIEMGSDFRVPQIGADAEAEIRAEIDRRTKSAVEGVVKAVWEQIGSHVGHMVERLRLYEERENKEDRDPKDKSGVFRNSMVENLRDLVERLPLLNVTDSPEVEKMRQRLLKQLCIVEPEDLRTMPLHRKEVLATAEKILADVSEFLA